MCEQPSRFLTLREDLHVVIDLGDVHCITKLQTCVSMIYARQGGNSAVQSKCLSTAENLMANILKGDKVEIVGRLTKTTVMPLARHYEAEIACLDVDNVAGPRFSSALPFDTAVEQR